MENKNIWLTYSAEEKEELHKICELYKSWLDKGKTERECVELAVEMAKKAGYRDIKKRRDIIILRNTCQKRDKSRKGKKFMLSA